MATTNSIGTTGRDYSTLQSWEDAVPATPTGGYIGECYNDSEFTAVVDIGGHTTSSSNFITLTAAAGQSFADHASKATNPLRYDQSKGVGVTASFDNIGGIINGSDTAPNGHVTISRLQVKNTVAGYASVAIRLSGTSCVINQCISEGSPGPGTGRAVVALKEASLVVNTVAICRRSNGGSGMDIGIANGTCKAINCTVVAPSDLATKPAVGILLHYSGNEIRNCAVFGFTDDSTGGTTPTIQTSQSDDTTPATGFTGSKTYANQFQNTTGAAADFRIKAGADLIDAGTDVHVATPAAATDIIGTARTTYDVGAWEVAGAGPTSWGRLMASDLNRLVTIYGR